MAERRMFAKTIIDSDAFLDMPLTAQALYFHLAMRADDDGFVNSPRKVLRAIGANTDDMRLLITKGFVIEFDSGVVCIKHWRIHNYIQRDRYKPTVYQEEFSSINTKENGAYTASLDTKCVQAVSNLDTNGIPTGYRMDTQGSIELNKNRVIYRVGGNNGVDNEIDDPIVTPTNPPIQPPTIEEVIEYVKERGDKIDAEKFFDTYSSNGWRTARGVQIKDWKAAVRAWERTEYPDKVKPTPQDKVDVSSSFDTDSFFAAALAKTYGEDFK